MESGRAQMIGNKRARNERGCLFELLTTKYIIIFITSIMFHYRRGNAHCLTRHSQYVPPKMATTSSV